MLEGIDHTSEIESSGLSIVVGILDELESSVLDDLVVVSPGWLADIDISWAVGGNEFESQSQGSSSGEGLGRDNSSGLGGWAISTKNEISGSILESKDSVNGEVLLVVLQIKNDLLLDSLDNRENVWLFVVVSVGSDSQVDLLGILISLVSKSGSKDWIRWGHLDMSENIVGGLASR